MSMCYVLVGILDRIKLRFSVREMLTKSMLFSKPVAIIW